MPFNDDRPLFGSPPPSYGIGVIIVVAFVAVAGSYLLADRFNGRTVKEKAAPRQPATPATTRSEVVAPQPNVPPRGQTDPVQPAPAPVSPTTTVYLCKAYAGGTFWSDTICHTQRATIDRVATVPSHLPFDQQVAIAQQQANEAAPLYAVVPNGAPARIGPTNAPIAASYECEALRRQIVELDQSARSPQSGQMQDWIRERRMTVQARMNMLRC